jgi:outer membrane protein TolC
MYSWHFPNLMKVTIGSFLLAGCGGHDFAVVKGNPLSLFQAEKVRSVGGDNDTTDETSAYADSLDKILDGSLANQNDGTNFISAVLSALQKDPVVLSQRRAIKAKLAAIGVSEAQKEYRVTTTIYGGIEDITDNTKGVALGLNASRPIFDGGMLDAQIASKNFEADVAKSNLQATLNERAYKLGEIWIEVEKFDTLQSQIDERLSVLDPLIGQLEQVAKAGIGDVSKVTAAQRTVSAIRVTQSNISEGLAKARLGFASAYGEVKEDITYDSEFISGLVPAKLHDGLSQNAPVLLARYASYQAALANLEAIRAKGDFNVGFEARALRPLAGSGYDSDESVGLVARKTLFNGGMLESEIEEASALVEAAVADVESTYRQGVRVIQSAQQSIESMDKAIALAKTNAQVTADEIVYLRQQLIIGGSTLDSVLSAEARMYEAESKEINFIAERRKAELLIASSLGLLASALN